MTTENGKVRYGETVSGRQSNYGGYRLPAGLAVGPTVPLYQAVAFWGWQLGRPFSRDEVAEVFHIEVCRAGDVMSYIRRARSDRITSRQHYVRVPDGVRMRYLQIMTKPKVKGIPVALKPIHLMPSDGMSETSLSALRRWFISGSGTMPV